MYGRADELGSACRNAMLATARGLPLDHMGLFEVPLGQNNFGGAYYTKLAR